MCKSRNKKYSDFENVEKMKENEVPEEFPEGAFASPHDPWMKQGVEPDFKNDSDPEKFNNS